MRKPGGMHGIVGRLDVRHAIVADGRWLWVMAVPALVGLFGCTPTFRPEQADRGEKVDVDTFLHEHLQQEPMVTVAEAYRAMVILADGDDEHESFEGRRGELEERGIARPQWGLQRDACIDRGSVAYMMYKIIGARGGVNLNVVGRLGLGDRRYALREMVYMKIMDAGPTYRYVMGGELVDWMARADRYMAKHGIYEEETAQISELLESKLASRPAPASPPVQPR